MNIQPTNQPTVRLIHLTTKQLLNQPTNPATYNPDTKQPTNKTNPYPNPNRPANERTEYTINYPTN